jgi:hypothetical protein
MYIGLAIESSENFPFIFIYELLYFETKEINFNDKYKNDK